MSNCLEGFCLLYIEDSLFVTLSSYWGILTHAILKDKKAKQGDNGFVNYKPLPNTQNHLLDLLCVSVGKLPNNNINKNAGCLLAL